MHWKKWIHDYPWSLHGHVVWNTKFFWWKRNALSSKLELNKTDSINASAARIYDGCRPHSRASEHGRTECEAGVIDTLHYTGWRDSCSWRLFPAGLFEGFFFLPKTSSLRSSITCYTGRIPFFPSLIHFLCLFSSPLQRQKTQLKLQQLWESNLFVFGRNSVRHLRSIARE